MASGLIPTSTRFLHLQAFVITAGEGSFSKAARRLYITTSSLVQQITLLEKELGFPLFYRHYNGVSLTEAGEAFYGGSVRMLDMMEQTMKLTRAYARGEHTLRISLSSHALSPVLEAFALRYPDVHLHFVNVPYDGFHEGLQLLREGELDLFECEHTDEVEESGLHFFPTHQVKLCIAVSYRHRLASRAFITLADLQNEQVVLYEYLYAACTMLKDCPSLRHLEVVNTSYSEAEVANAMQEGKVYFFEDEWVDRLAPFCKAIPLSPPFYADYGLACRKGNAQAEAFLALLERRSHENE